MTRKRMVDAMLAMLALPMSLLDRPRSFLTLGMRGAKANQDVKAMKNPSHERWKARMWGRLILNRLKFVAWPFWSTLMF
jgi:hypothetical protein